MFTDKELEQLHAETFANAKAALLRDGRVVPLVLLAFDAPNPAAALDAVGLSIEDSRDAGDPADPRPRSTVAVIPTVMPAGVMMDVLARMIPTIGPKLAVLRQLAPAAGQRLEDFDSQMLKTFCSVNGIHEKDILARYLRWLAEKLDAYALFKVDEGWQKRVEPGEAERREQFGGPAVEDMPGRVEVVMVTFESRLRQGMRTVQILRKDPADETSKPVGFGEEVTSYSDVGGRFFDLIRRAS